MCAQANVFDVQRAGQFFYSLGSLARNTCAQVVLTEIPCHAMDLQRPRVGCRRRKHADTDNENKQPHRRLPQQSALRGYVFYAQPARLARRQSSSRDCRDMYGNWARLLRSGPRRDDAGGRGVARRAGFPRCGFQADFLRWKLEGRCNAAICWALTSLVRSNGEDRGLPYAAGERPQDALNDRTTGTAAPR